MRRCTGAALLACLLICAGAAPPADMPAAIYTDPPHDAAHPARFVVLHIPSHGVLINGIAYVAEGTGAHRAVILLHGLPGNEKNLDLAQAIRRAGWDVVAFNYRGSWGSPGVFRFGQTLEDAAAVLAYLRDPANAKSLDLDTNRLVLIGHSMGGWVAVNLAAQDGHVSGLVTISAADISRLSGAPEAMREKLMADSMESLAGVTPRSMAADAVANTSAYSFAKTAPALVQMPYLAMTADDGLAGDTDGLVAAIKTKGGTQVTMFHAPTDHGWDDHRIALEAAVISWLQKLPG